MMPLANKFNKPFNFKMGLLLWADFAVFAAGKVMGLYELVDKCLSQLETAKNTRWYRDFPNLLEKDGTKDSKTRRKIRFKKVVKVVEEVMTGVN